VCIYHISDVTGIAAKSGFFPLYKSVFALSQSIANFPSSARFILAHWLLCRVHARVDLSVTPGGCARVDVHAARDSMFVHCLSVGDVS